MTALDTKGLVYAGIDTARIGSLSLVLTDTIVSSQTASVVDDTYAHFDLSSVIGSGNYTALKSAVEAALFAASPSADFTVVFDWTGAAAKYQISSTTGAITLDFTSAAGQRLAAALGYTAANPLAISGSGYACVLQQPLTDTEIVSDVLPYYLVPLAREDPAEYSRPHEEEGFVRRAFSKNANGYSVEPPSIPEAVDFKTLYLPLANVFQAEAAAAEPWTVEHLIKHARAHDPLLFRFTTAGDIVGKLDPRFATFTKNMREVAFAQARDYHGKWHVSWELQYLGVL